MQEAMQWGAVAAAQQTTLGAALVWYVERGRPLRAAPAVEWCVGIYLAQLRATGRRKVTLDGYRSVLRRFAVRWAGRSPIGIGAEAWRAFAEEFAHGPTRRAVRRRLFVFCGWLVRRRWLLENPLRAMPVPRWRPRLGAIYSPGEVAAILRLTVGQDQLGYWVLALFAGLRSKEIQRLAAAKDPWRIVRPEAGVIDLPADITKNRPRVVPIEPVLGAWLAVVRRLGLPFFPRSSAEKLKGTRALLRRGMRDGPGCRNLARRSFVSYRLALPGASYAAVAEAAGNSEPMIRHYYRTEVDPRDAVAYFALGPEAIV